MSRPFTSTEPLVGSSSAATISSSVVLPEPLGPYRATISPGATDNETPSTARTDSPPRCGVVLDEIAQLQHPHPLPGRACRQASTPLDSVRPRGGGARKGIAASPNEAPARKISSAGAARARAPPALPARPSRSREGRTLGSRRDRWQAIAAPESSCRHRRGAPVPRPASACEPAHARRGFLRGG